ncbi:GCY3E-like protein [Mya arenaria]|uniref:guanylate cyclase n=1 Tax=Mya arenaria TaxID=6604 RepID=A0ABY7DFW1_MYAAR|nr:GCY3E-like protein [Mya arenaria]
MGYILRINELGDSEGNYTLVARDVFREAYTPDLLGPGVTQYGIYPVGVFRLNEKQSTPPELPTLPTYHFYEGSYIDWVDGKPPIDEPPCGFRGEKCIPPKSAFDVLEIMVINWKYENDLASLLWKLDYKDIDFKDHFVGTMSTKCGNKGRRNTIIRVRSMLFQVGDCQRTAMVRVNSQMSLASQGEFDFRQLFTCVATYKGMIVAVRKIRKKHIEITRNIKKELKVIRDLRHENLNPFIGACVDTPHILVVTAYCSKGSLTDILENDDIQLDDMFRASLVFDIIRVTDFGLNEFLEGEDEDDEGDFAKYRNMLWRAPELLRAEDAPRRGTQEGDVYSFAIIMYEIHGRKGPYGDLDLSPKAIITRVMERRDDVPFRPHLGELLTTSKTVIDALRDCWDEEPSRRPDFKTIRNRLKPIQKGMKPNILDNMIAIMEKYASNLEALVEEKTDQLRDEKKKTEEILLQMLPKAVTEQLKRGKVVEAEHFDCATIYFSDICGFTALSAYSSPMQVETIGDAYMVGSGLPKRNGILHADCFHVSSFAQGYQTVQNPTPARGYPQTANRDPHRPLCGRGSRT